jgi:hypothetical protein
MSGDSSSYSNTEDIDRRLEINVSDFCFGCTLGEGAYARVVHAKSKHSLDEYAVKIMEKVHIKKENKVRGSYQPQCSGLTPCLIHIHHIISCRSKRS